MRTSGDASNHRPPYRGLLCSHPPHAWRLTEQNSSRTTALESTHTHTHATRTARSLAHQCAVAPAQTSRREKLSYPVACTLVSCCTAIGTAKMNAINPTHPLGGALQRGACRQVYPNLHTSMHAHLLHVQISCCCCSIIASFPDSSAPRSCELLHRVLARTPACSSAQRLPIG